MKIEIDRELLVQALDYIDNGPYYNKPLVDALREALDKSHQELLLTPSQIIHSDACMENKVTIYEEVSPSEVDPKILAKIMAHADSLGEEVEVEIFRTVNSKRLT